MQDPARIALLVHDDGVVVPDLEKIYKTQVAHDPSNLAAARRIAEATEHIHLGVLFRDPSRLRYEDLAGPATHRRRAAHPRWTRSWIAMPSDARVTMALVAVAQPIAEFRSIIQGALAQAETFVVDQAANRAERADRAEVELGWFATGRIDPARFATLFPAVPPVHARGDGGAQPRHRRLCAPSRTAATRRFLVDLPRGGRLGARSVMRWPRSARLRRGDPDSMQSASGTLSAESRARPPARSAGVSSLEQGRAPLSRRR